MSAWWLLLIPPAVLLLALAAIVVLGYYLPVDGARQRGLDDPERLR